MMKDERKKKEETRKRKQNCKSYMLSLQTDSSKRSLSNGPGAWLFQLSIQLGHYSASLRLPAFPFLFPFPVKKCGCKND
jgi:hypothetical protein